MLFMHLRIFQQLSYMYICNFTHSYDTITQLFQSQQFVPYVFVYFPTNMVAIYLYK